MENILIEGQRLKLRKATETDLNFILSLENAEENLKFIVPFGEEFHTKILKSDGSEKMDVIAEEIGTGTRAGYFMLQDVDNPFKNLEITHVIIDKKGRGYGTESLKLLLKWSFEVKNFHRAWLDCKTYNEVALHLYEKVGFRREGLIRECILTNGIYEDLLVLGILQRECSF